MDPLTLVEAATLDATRRAALQAIYEEAFPPELSSAFDSLLADRALALVDAAGSPAGLAVLRDLPGTTWTFLRYYVVGLRGQGVGSAFWSLLRDAHPDRTRIVLDVEDPDEPGTDAAEVDLRHRRIAFYERLGVCHLPVEAYLPPHDGVPLPLRLMVADLTQPLGDPTPVPGDLRALVLATYAGRYGLAADHPVVVETLRASGLA